MRPTTQPRVYDTGFPALLGPDWRCGTRDLRSLRQSSLHPVCPCDARLRQRDPGCQLRGMLYPLGAAEHRRSKTDKREDCLTERSEGVPQRPFSAEERRAVGAQRRPSRGVPFLLPSFLWASKEKKGACGPPPAVETGRAPPSAINTPPPTGNKSDNCLRLTSSRPPDHTPFGPRPRHRCIDRPLHPLTGCNPLDRPVPDTPPHQP